MSAQRADDGLWALEVDAPSDPLTIARALAHVGLRQVTLLHASAPDLPGSSAQGVEVGTPPELSSGHGRYSYVAAQPDRCSHRLDPVADDPDPPSGRVLAPRAAGGALDAEGDSAAPHRSSLLRAPRWIGVIPYEARRSLERPSWCQEDTRSAPLLCRPRWWRFPAVVRIDHVLEQVAVLALDARALVRLEQALQQGLGARRSLRPGGVELHLLDDEPPERHLDRIRKVRELIHAGDVYQVNVARRLGLELREGTALDLHARLVQAAPSALSAMLQLGDDITVLATTPELLLHAATVASSGSTSASGSAAGAERWPRFGWLATEPIKGTRPRGRDTAEDERLAQELDEDPKERAELTMIIDVERNDLGRVCQVGSVEVRRHPQVVCSHTVFHRKARIEGHARPELGRSEVLESMVPSGSVTGAPKVRAMEIIRDIESHRRGLYTGGLGYVAHDGSIMLAMAIRTAVLRGRSGVYWTGGGIVADSDPHRELDETWWKAAQLLRTAAGQAS